MLIAGCRVRWSKYNCWNIMNSEENSNDNESLWCVSILLSPSFNNNAQFNKTEELPREKSLPLRLQQPPQGPCLHIKPQLCLRLEKKYLKPPEIHTFRRKTVWRRILSTGFTLRILTITTSFSPFFQLKCSNYAFYMDIETVTILFMT